MFQDKIPLKQSAPACGSCRRARPVTAPFSRRVSSDARLCDALPRWVDTRPLAPRRDRRQCSPRRAASDRRRARAAQCDARLIASSDTVRSLVRGIVTEGVRIGAGAVLSANVVDRQCPHHRRNGLGAGGIRGAAPPRVRRRARKCCGAALPAGATGACLPRGSCARGVARRAESERRACESSSSPSSLRGRRVPVVQHERVAVRLM